MQEVSGMADQGLWKKVHKTPELVHADAVVVVDVQHVNHVLAVLYADRQPQLAHGPGLHAVDLEVSQSQ